MLLRQLLTYYGAIIAEIIDKRDKKRGVITGILNKEWFSNFMLVY